MRLFKQEGSVILSSTIVILVVTLLISLSINLLSLGELLSTDNSDDTHRSDYYADGCIEEALLRLNRDSNYTGGTISINQIKCQVKVTDTGGSTRHILAEGIFNDHYQGVEVDYDITPRLRSNWSRCPSEGTVRLEAALITSLDHNWQRVVFRQCYQNPIIKAMQFELNDSQANSVRIRNITNSGFDIRLQNASNSSITAEQVTYLVVEEGIHTLSDSTKIEAHYLTTNTLGHDASWLADTVSYGHTYSSAPVVLSQVLSSYDDSWVTSWISGSTQGDPPSTSVLKVGLNVAEANPVHAVEQIGWIAVDSGITSIINSIDYETITTGDIVNGHDDGCDTISYSNSYSANPILVGDVLGLNDSNGGWLVQCGQSTTFANVHVEEDQIADSERAHSAESVGIIVFSNGFIYP